jgi:hypothetical protein
MGQEIFLGVFEVILLFCNVTMHIAWYLEIDLTPAISSDHQQDYRIQK